MKATSRLIRTGCALAAFVAILGIELRMDGAMPKVSMLSEALAIVGRPLTPVSVAGTARRTTRRVVRRTAYVASLPPTGCTQVKINGEMYFQCGSTFYQAEGSQYVIVTVD